MKDFRQVIGGILIALLSLALLVGSINLALVESAPRVAQAVTPTPARSPNPTRSTGSLLPGEAPPRITETATLPSPPPTSSCPVPPGWQTITIGPGDTLESLSALYRVSREALAEGNCLTLDIETLISGTTLNVPLLLFSPTPTPLATPTRCGPPAGWVKYTVQSGDTLYGLSQILGVSVEQIKAANCLQSNTIYVNQRLFVPFLPPAPTRLPTRTPTRAPTATIPPPTPSNTSVPTPTPAIPSTGTPTVANPPTETPTNLPVPTHTATPPPTDTETPPPTGTPTPEPTATATQPAPVTPTPTTTPTL